MFTILTMLVGSLLSLNEENILSLLLQTAKPARNVVVNVYKHKYEWRLTRFFELHLSLRKVVMFPGLLLPALPRKLLANKVLTSLVYFSSQGLDKFH